MILDYLPEGCHWNMAAAMYDVTGRSSAGIIMTSQELITSEICKIGRLFFLQRAFNTWFIQTFLYHGDVR